MSNLPWCDADCPVCGGACQAPHDSDETHCKWDDHECYKKHKWKKKGTMRGKKR